MAPRRKVKLLNSKALAQTLEVQQDKQVAVTHVLQLIVDNN
jgi:hypothetical protein